MDPIELALKAHERKLDVAEGTVDGKHIKVVRDRFLLMVYVDDMLQHVSTHILERQARKEFEKLCYKYGLNARAEGIRNAETR